MSDNEPEIFYLHLSDNTPTSEEQMMMDDGQTATVIWKDILVEGEYPMSPRGISSGASHQPMKVIPEGDSDVATRTISMSDVIDAHEAGAFKYVTIPATHKDHVLENTGYVPRPGGVRKVEKNGKKVLQAALGFTEPDVKGKVKRGTIPDVSPGIFFNFRRKSDKKVFPAAMKHVSLSGIPFMGNLERFPAVFASDEEGEIPEGTKISVFTFSDEEDSKDDNSSKTVEVVWNETDGYRFITEALNNALRPEPPVDDGRPHVERPSYFVEDVSKADTALVTEWYKGDKTRWVIPFSREDGGEVKIAPSNRWIESKEAMIAASDSTINGDNFTDLTPDKVREKLSVNLSDIVGGDDFVVDSIAMDRRCLIRNEKTGARFVAGFALFDDSSTLLAPAHEWERTTPVDPPKPKADTPVPAPQKQTEVKQFDLNTPEGRVQAARSKRRLSSMTTADK